MNRKGLIFKGGLDDHIENYSHEQTKKRILG